MSITHSKFAVVAISLAALALAACSDDEETTSDTSAAVATTAAGAAPATDADAPATDAPATDAPAGDAVDVMLADSSLGQILVDGEGRTVYLFTNDSAGTSTCSGECAANWPALTVDAEPAVGEGLTAGDFATITGADGATQVTFHDHPLYYFAGDSAPGDINGHNVNSVWFAVDAGGNAVPG
jgi:predicted lipoprotein with Yx(FWY)xxD motif